MKQINCNLAVRCCCGSQGFDKNLSPQAFCWHTLRLCFSLFFPVMGACCAQIKGFTLVRRELVLVRPNVKPFI